MRAAFDLFRRKLERLEAQLRVLESARHGAYVEPSGHAVRADALHLIRAAAAFADTLEDDAQRAASQLLGRTDGERDELLEAARRDAVELAGAARADVERTLEWARAQADAILARARASSEQLLAASGLGEEAVADVVRAIVAAAEEATGRPRGSISPEAADDRPRGERAGRLPGLAT